MKLEENLAQTSGFRVFLRVKNAPGKVNTGRLLLENTTEEMIASAVREKKVQSKSCDKILESVKPEAA